MSGGQDHAGLPYLRYLHEIGPAGRPAATVAPGAMSGIEPTPVGQTANRHAMGPTAALADAGSPLKSHAAADLRPIGGIKPLHFRSDRHYLPPPLAALPAACLRADERHMPGQFEPVGDRHRAELSPGEGEQLCRQSTACGPCRRRTLGMIPANCHSRRRLVSNSGNTPNMSINTLAATVPVSLGANAPAAALRHSRHRGRFWLG